MKKIKNILILACTFVAVLFAFFSIPLNSAANAKDLNPGYTWEVSKEDFNVFWGDNATLKNLREINFNSNYYYSTSSADTREIFIETTTAGNYIANGSISNIYADYIKNDGTPGTITAAQFTTHNNQLVSFTIPAGSAATYYIKGEVRVGGGSVEVDLNLAPFIFSAFPEAEDIINATETANENSFVFYGGTLETGKITLPRITFDTNFYNVEIVHSKGANAFQHSDSGNLRTIYFKEIGDYEIKYYQKTKPGVEELAKTQTLSFYGAKIMYDNVNSREFLNVSSDGVLTTAEVPNTINTTAAVDSLPALVSTNQTDVWWHYSYPGTALAGDVFETKIVGLDASELNPNGFFYYKPSRESSTWTQKKFNPNTGHSVTGVYFVGITITTTKDGAPYSTKTQYFAFEIKSTNPIISLTTQKSEFTENGAVLGAEFELQNEEFTNNDVTFSHEDHGMFDIAPEFFVVKNGGSKMLITKGDIIRAPITKSFDNYTIIATFGRNTVNEKSQVITTFTIDTTDVILSPNEIKDVYNTETEKYVETAFKIDDETTVIASDFKIGAEKKQSNAAIVQAQMRYVLFNVDAGFNEANAENAILSGGTYVAALLKGAARTDWENFDPKNTKLSAAGFYEFRFMDKASNVAYYYIYIDKIAPNIVYDGGKSTTPSDPNDVAYNYTTHTVVYGEFKAVELPADLRPTIQNTYLKSGVSLDVTELGGKFYFTTQINNLPSDNTQQLSKGGTARGAVSLTAAANGFVTKNINSKGFFVKENHKANEGVYSYAVRDIFGNFNGGGTFRVDFDLARTQIVASTGNDNAATYENGLPNIKQGTDEGDNDTASGTNFNILNLSAIVSGSAAGSRPAYQLNYLKVEYTAPVITNGEISYGTVTKIETIYDFAAPSGLTLQTFNYYTLNDNNGDGTTDEGKYTIKVELDPQWGGSLPTKDIDGDELYDAEKVYTIYVDRTDVFDVPQQIGKSTYVDFYNGAAYQGEIKRLNVETAGFKSVNGQFGVIDISPLLPSVNSNLVSANFIKSDTKYGAASATIPSVLNLTAEVDGLPYEGAVPPISEVGLHNVVVSDRLNSLIKLADGTQLYGNVSAFSFAINNNVPKGSVPTVELPDPALESFEKVSEFAAYVVDENGEFVLSTVQPNDSSNTIFLRSGDRAKSATFNFVIDNTQKPFDAIINFDATKIKINGTSVATSMYQQRIGTSRQLLTLPRTNGVTYTITVEYYDTQNNLFGFRTADYKIIIDGTSPQHNIVEVQKENFYTAAKAQGVEIERNYFYVLPQNFVFTLSGLNTNLNTYQDTHKIYYRRVGRVINDSIDNTLHTIFEYETGFDSDSNKNPKFDQSASYFKTTYIPFNYNDIAFANIAGSGLFEIVETDAAGNAISYFVHTPVSTSTANRITFAFANYFAGETNANGTPKVSPQNETISSAISSVTTINTVATKTGLNVNLNFSVIGIDSKDKYFKVEVADTTFLPAGSQPSYLPAVYINAKTETDLTNAILSQINYNETYGNQVMIRIFDRLSSPAGESYYSYYTIRLNISPIENITVERDTTVENTVIGLKYSKEMPNNYNSYQISEFVCENVNNATITYNPTQKNLPLGTYHLTYKNNYGYSFSHYVSTTDESAYFKSAQGAQSYDEGYGKKDYFGDGLSFYYSKDAFTFETMTVVINGQTQIFTEGRLGDFVESTSTEKVVIGGRPVDMVVLKFKSFSEMRIDYSIKLSYKLGVGSEAIRTKTVDGVYYTQTPKIEVMNAFNVLEELSETNKTIRTTKAVLETYSPESTLFTSATSLKVSAIGTTLDGDKQQIKWGGNAEPYITRGFIFTIENTNYKRIDYTLTLQNSLGLAITYFIIIDSEQYPTYIVSQGSIVLKPSTQEFTAPSTMLINEAEFAAGVKCKQYYTTGELSESMITLAEDKLPELTKRRIDNGLNPNVMIFKIHSASTTFSELKYIKITKIPKTTSLAGLSLTPDSQTVSNSTGQSSITISYRPNGNPDYNNISSLYCGLEYYAVVSVENYSIENLNGLISLTSSGVYAITYYDLAGNMHNFSQVSTTQSVALINTVLVNASAPNYSGELSNDMVFENSVTITATNQSLYNGTLVVKSAKLNGEAISVGLTQKLDRTGVYEIEYEGYMSGTMRKTGKYRIFVVNPNEQRLGLEFNLSNAGSTIQSIQTIHQRDVAARVGLGENVTPLFRLSQKLSADALLTRAILSEYESGNGYFTVVVKIDSLSEFKPTTFYTFRVLINNDVPVITANVKFGITTSKRVLLTYVPYDIFTNYGSVMIKVNDDAYTVNAGNQNDREESVIELETGVNVIEISTESGSMIYSRYTIVRTQPLTFISVIIIIAGVAVLSVAVVIFFRLRTKMKVR